MAKQQTKQAVNTVNNTVSNANQQVPQQVSNIQNLQGAAKSQSDIGFAGAQQNYENAGDTYGKAVTGFQDMADTGGFTPEDKSAYLSRAADSATSAYKTAADQAARTRAAAGGLGTGGEAVALARGASQAGAKATEEAQADLTQQINANKLAGLSGLNSSASGETSIGNGEGSLYNSANNTLTEQGRQVLQAMGLQYSTDMEGAQILQQLSKNPGLLQNTASVLGMLGGAATSAISGYNAVQA